MQDDYIDHPYPRAVKRFPALRQSLLSSFDNCSLTTYFDHEYRKGWSTTPQGRGQLFHRFAGECLKTMSSLGEEMIPVDAALAILRDVLRQDDADRECPKCGGAVKPGIDRRTCQRTCEAGHKFDTQLVNVPIDMAKDLHWIAVKWAHDNAFDIGNLVDVEQRLRAGVRYPDRRRGGTVPRTLTGQIDALFVEGTERAIVIDWKDTWALPAETDVSFGGYFQQRFYAWLVFRAYPTVQEVVLREFYVRFSKTREATVWRTDEEEIHDELAALAERFDRQWEEQLVLEEAAGPAGKERWAFVPTPGKHCSFCIRPSGCPIPVFGRGEGRITDQGRAEQVARQLIVAEEVVKRARHDLRAYAATHGPIPVKDAKGKRALGYVEETRVERPDFEAIAQLERELGRPPSAAEIKALYKVRHGTKFKAHNPVEVDEAAADAEIQAQLEASIAAAQARMRELPQPPSDGKVVPLRPRDRRPKEPSGVRPRVADTDQGVS